MFMTVIFLPVHENRFENSKFKSCCHFLFGQTKLYLLEFLLQTCSEKSEQKRNLGKRVHLENMPN